MRSAYDRGVRAHAAHDHVAAARAFAEADALAPQAASLEAVLESVTRADDALLGAELVDRAAGRAGDPGVARSLEAARKRFGGRTGKVKMDCHGDARCVAAVDGTPADARKVIYVIAGPHAVVVQRGEERFERLVDVGADGTVVVWIPAAGAAVAERDREREPGTGTTRVEKESGGTSPSWFFCRGRGDRRDWRGDGVQWARCFEEARSIFRGCLWGWGDGGAAARLRAAGAGGKERAAPHESLAGSDGGARCGHRRGRDLCRAVEERREREAHREDAAVGRARGLRDRHVLEQG